MCKTLSVKIYFYLTERIIVKKENLLVLWLFSGVTQHRPNYSTVLSVANMSAPAQHSRERKQG